MQAHQCVSLYQHTEHSKQINEMNGDRRSAPLVSNSI